MLDHPATTLRRSALKLADFWGLEREWLAGIQQGLYRPPTWFAVVSGAAVLAVFPAVLLLAIAGLLLAPPRDRRAHWLFVALLLFVAGLHSLTFGHSRYHLPLVPILLLYAASVLCRPARIVERLRTREAALAGAACSAAALVWVREVFVRDAAHVAALMRLVRDVT
jgi:hypothetical protein